MMKLNIQDTDGHSRRGRGDLAEALSVRGRTVPLPTTELKGQGRLFERSRISYLLGFVTASAFCAKAWQVSPAVLAGDWAPCTQARVITRVVSRHRGRASVHPRLLSSDVHIPWVRKLQGAYIGGPRDHISGA